MLARVTPPTHTRSRRRRRLVTVALAALAAIGAVLGVALLEARSLHTHRVAVVSADLPAAFDGLRVAFIADIHLGPFVSGGYVHRVVNEVNGLHPDLVILGGDYAYRDAAAIPAAFVQLARLRAPLGVYAVLGNHDHYLGATATSAAMAAAGIHDVDNRGVWLTRGGSRLRLGGVDDLWKGAQNLPGAVGDARERDFVLLVSHNPDYAERLHGAPVDLMLSGHTHGGQVALPGWAPILPSNYGQKYRAGIAHAGRTTVLVTTGVGTTVVPLRLFARPEIVLLTLRAGTGAAGTASSGG
jgi:predicted MPP superfamily phosphohydrolase